MVWMAELRIRSPPRLRRCRVVWPDDAFDRGNTGEGGEQITELLDPLRRLTRKHPDLQPTVLATAVDILRITADLQAAACVTELCEHLTPATLDQASVQSLIVCAGAPDDPFSSSGGRRANDLSALRAVADIAPDCVVESLRELLPTTQSNSSLILPPGSGNPRVPDRVDDFHRASAAGAIQGLASTNPVVARSLIDDLVQSLAIDADDSSPGPGEPIVASQVALAAMVVLDVGQVGPSRESAGTGAGERMRERLFGVLEQVTRQVDPDDRWRDPGDEPLDDHRRCELFDQLVRTCLSRVGGDWGLKVGRQAAEIIAKLAEHDPVWAVDHLDSFVGAFLGAAERINTSPARSLAVVDTTPAFLAGLNQVAARQEAAATAYDLTKAITATADAAPRRVCSRLATVMADERDNERGAEVRWRLVAELGKIGRRQGAEPDVLAQIVPILHSYLVDDDAGLRSRSLDAWVKIAAAHDLPSSVNDLLPALVSDRHVVVVEALLGAATRLHWTDQERNLLARYALQMCAAADHEAGGEVVPKAMTALRSLCPTGSDMRRIAEKVIVKRVGEFDGYELREALYGRWEPDVEHSEEMTQLRLRHARQAINDRLNGANDPA